jgi:hypothetical protein
MKILSSLANFRVFLCRQNNLFDMQEALQAMRGPVGIIPENATDLNKISNGILEPCQTRQPEY